MTAQMKESTVQSRTEVDRKHTETADSADEPLGKQSSSSKMNLLHASWRGNKKKGQSSTSHEEDASSLTLSTQVK